MTTIEDSLVAKRESHTHTPQDLCALASGKLAGRISECVKPTFERPEQSVFRESRVALSGDNRDLASVDALVDAAFDDWVLHGEIGMFDRNVPNTLVWHESKTSAGVTCTAHVEMALDAEHGVLTLSWCCMSKKEFDEISKLGIVNIKEQKA